MNVEELIYDAQFRAWVIKPTPSLNKYWSNKINSDPQFARKVRIARTTIEEIRREQFVYSQYDQHILWERIQIDLNNSGESTLGSQGREEEANFFQTGNWVPSAVAASFLIMAIFLRLWLFNQTEINNAIVTKQNPVGQKSKITLPDGSLVWLNAESSIWFPNGFNDSIRYVEIVGEGFFDVVKDLRPFTVKASKLEIEVLGTEFNVRSFDQNNTTVSLIEGKVEVTGMDNIGRSIGTSLLPGEEIKFDGAKLNKGSFEQEQRIGWKDGVLIFRNADANEVLSRLSRWYAVSFEYEGEKLDQLDWSYTSSFKDMSLESVLSAIAYTENFRYKINKDKVIIVFDRE